MLITLLMLGGPSCSDSGGSSWQSRNSYAATLERFAALLIEADGVIDSIRSVSDANASKGTVERLIGEFNALAEEAKSLQPPERLNVDEIVELARPADDAQVELLESIDRLRFEHDDAATVLMIELTRLRGAVQEVQRNIARPNRDAEFEQVRRRMEEQVERERAERTDGTWRTSDRRRGLARPPVARSFDERRAQMIEEHGADRVLTVILIDCPTDVHLRRFVDLVRERIPAKSHSASGAGTVRSIAIAPVSISIDNAADQLDLGTVEGIDRVERTITIRFDAEIPPE